MKKYILLTVLTALSFKLFAGGGLPSKDIAAFSTSKESKKKISDILDDIKNLKTMLGVSERSPLAVQVSIMNAQLLSSLISKVNDNLEAKLDTLLNLQKSK